MNRIGNFDKSRPPRILIVAGEVSGDRQAGDLARAILSLRPDAVLYGTGGEKMRDAGVNLLVQSTQYGSVGIQIRYVRPLQRVMSQLRAIVKVQRPDLAVLVDNEGFNRLFAEYLYSRKIPFVFFFPPQVSIWGPWRARAVSRRAEVIVPAFKAEAEIYRREGGNVQWFGHPLLDIVRTDADPDRILAGYGLNPKERTIGIMPGSRFQEIDQLLSLLLSAAKIIKKTFPSIQIILPMAAPHFRESLNAGIAAHGMTGAVTVVSDHIYTCMSKCDVVMVASGTATIELALLGVPMVVGYKVSRITYAVGRWFMNVRYIAMPSILLDRKVVPEFLQNAATPEVFAREALRLLVDRDLAAQTRRELALVRPLLGEPGALTKTAALVLAEAERRIPAEDRQAVAVE